MKSLYKLTLTVVFSLSLIACGSENTETKQTKEPTPEKTEQKLPADAMVVKVAVTRDYAPYCFVDEKGMSIGYDIDFMQAIAEEENFKVEFVIVPWLSFAKSLVSGETDVGLSTDLVGTNEQKSKFVASKAYLQTKIGYGVKSDSPYFQASDLNGKSISVQKNTDFVHLLTENNPTAKAQEKITTYLAYADVISNKVNATFNDESLIGYQTIAFPEYPMRFIPATEGGLGHHIAFSASENKQEIIDKINSGFQKIQQNGKYQKINKKWFGKHADDVAIK